MKKKFSMMVLSLVFAAMLITGCMKVEEDFQVNANGSGKISSEVLAEKEELLSVAKKITEAEGGTFDKKVFTAALIGAGYKIVKEDGKEYFSFTDDTTGNRSFQSIREFYRPKDVQIQALSNMVRSEKSKDDYISLTETSLEAAVTGNTEELLPDFDLDEIMGGIGITQEQMQNSKLLLSVTFATPIAKVSEGAELSEDRKTAHFVIPLVSAKTATVFAYCENDIAVKGVASGIVYGRDVTYTIPDGVSAALNGKAVSGKVTSKKSGFYQLSLKAGDGTQKSIYYEIDKDKPVISGIKKNGIYNKEVEVKVQDKSGIVNATLDGRNILSELGGYDTKASNSGMMRYAYTPSSLKDGKHTFKFGDPLGHSASVTFVIDKTAPKVSGVKNGKTYKKAVKIKVTDKNGVKSVKLNGKAIKSGKKVSKKGKYTLVAKDKAGNKKTVKFKIEKKK